MAGTASSKTSKAIGKLPVRAARKSNPAKHGKSTQVALHKPTATAPQIANLSTQSVDVTQSMQVMQTLLHSCLSSVTFHRSIFPEACYHHRYYSNSSGQWSYHDYSSDSHGGATREIFSRDKSGKTMIALKRGVSGRVDRFHDLLEKGVFDALQRGFAKALQLSVHENLDGDEYQFDILEAWTFTFHYNGAKALTGIELQERESNVITLSQAKMSLNDFVRNLTGLCGSMPALPHNKSVAMQMTYTDESPPAYRAPGFGHDIPNLARYPANDEWSRLTLEAGIVSTGHHTAALKVSHLHSKNPDVYSIPSEELEYSHEATIFEDAVEDLDKRVEELQKSRPKSKPSKSKEFSRTLSPHEEMNNRPANAMSNLEQSSTADEMEQSELRNMLQSSENTSNTQVTQLARSLQHSSSSLEPQNRLAFSQIRIEQLDRDRSALLAPRQGTVDIRNINEDLDLITIRCECGCVDRDSEQILCEFCMTLQHLPCMGYLGRDDNRLPDTYVCHKCLLGRDERKLRQIRELVSKRRAIWLLQATSYDDAKSFGKALNLTVPETEKLLGELRKDGLLSKMAGRTKPLVVLNRSEEARLYMEKVFFKPALGLSHHLEHQASTGNECQPESRLESQKRARSPAIDSEPRPLSKRVLVSSTNRIDGKEVLTPKSARRN